MSLVCVWKQVQDISTHLEKYYASTPLFSQKVREEIMWVVSDNLKNYWETYKLSFHKFSPLNFDLWLFILDTKVQHKPSKKTARQCFCCQPPHKTLEPKKETEKKLFPSLKHLIERVRVREISEEIFIDTEKSGKEWKNSETTICSIFISLSFPNATLPCRSITSIASLFLQFIPEKKVYTSPKPHNYSDVVKGQVYSLLMPFAIKIIII